ncbi:hypothetical protein CCR75_000383 [Bremia lactucae]|uniref:Peptidylprolyl isomerase n=1 Tax=Bremia lactucae TaxID=4779 RepID=A0A976IG21_BRELC|nr:hypothetical protein CCR75_000383 [Bremia lactucae]
MTINEGSGYIHWALYKDAVCLDTDCVLCGSLLADQLRLPLLHKGQNSPESVVTGIQLAPELQRHFQNVLSQQRVGDGQSDRKPLDTSNEAVPVAVIDLALGARAAKLGLDDKAYLYCKLQLESPNLMADEEKKSDWFSWKIMRASEYQNRGREADTLNKDYISALGLYKRASRWLEPLSDSKADFTVQYSEEELQVVNKMAGECYTLTASCYWKLDREKNANRCIDVASKALKLSDANIKARFVRSMAYVVLKEFDLAIADLTILCEHSPNNQKYQSLLARTRKAKTQLRTKQQRAFAVLFES